MPGSASNNLHKMVMRGVKQSWQQRLLQTDFLRQRHKSLLKEAEEANMCPVDLIVNELCNVNSFRSMASFLDTAKQSQHADYSHLERRFLVRNFHGTFVHSEPIPGQRIMVCSKSLSFFFHTTATRNGKKRLIFLLKANQKHFCFHALIFFLILSYVVDTSILHMTRQ